MGCLIAILGFVALLFLGVQAAPITELPSPEGTASGPRLCGQYRLSSGEEMSGAALRLDEARSVIEEVRTVPCD